MYDQVCDRHIGVYFSWQSTSNFQAHLIQTERLVQAMTSKKNRLDEFSQQGWWNYY